MQLLIAFLSLFAASGYVLFLDHLLMSPRSLQKVLVIPIIFMVVICYYFAKKSWRIITNRYDKWLFLFGGAALTQLLVVATGGFQSPFLILIHLCMIGLSFLFSFSISVLFLLFAFVTIFVDMSFYQNILTLLLNSPNVILLQVVSLLSIIPIAYLISQQYHAREIVANLLKQKVTRDETIFSNLSEMIIVTDAQLHILSVNDSAAKTLQNSRSELLGKPLFDVLLLKDANNRLVTKETFSTKSPQSEFTLMRSPIPERTVTMYAQSIKNNEEDINEISFILTYTHAPQDPLVTTLDKARAKYETLMQSIKRQLQAHTLQRAETDLLLLEKIENDTYILQSLRALQGQTSKERIDIAQLCKHIVQLNSDFASKLGVKLSFALEHFGAKDIAPLTVKNFPVKPEQLTGPFFTAECDSKKIEMTIEKMVDVAVFLAAGTTKAAVRVAVQPQPKGTITVIITAAAQVTQKNLSQIFTPYYGTIADMGKLRDSSGLGGVILHEISTSLGIMVKTKSDVNGLTLSVCIPKRPGN